MAAGPANLELAEALIAAIDDREGLTIRTRRAVEETADDR